MSLNGIDIASYQAGLDLSVVPCDFVIVKATQGTTYTNPYCVGHVEQAINLGKLFGTYHYITGVGAVAEADFYVNSISNWVGKGIMCLDWESGDNSAWGNESYLREMAKRVIDRTGIPPVIYVQASRYSQVKAVADELNCGLWIAQYADMNPTGYQDSPWNEGSYSCAIRQYASTGRLNGWDGNLDINKFYGDASTWNAYAGAKTNKNMSQAGLQPIANQAYTGSECKPQVVSSAGATFDVSYRDNVNVGWATAVATGNGDWEGSAEVAFKILPENLVRFNDVDPSVWYVDDIQNAVASGAMSGVGENFFAPDDALTRAMAVTLIYKAAGNVVDTLPYSDVEQAPWYYDATEWATDKGIIHGNDGKMRPDDACIRAEFVVMLCRWTGTESDKEHTEFSDWQDVPDYAKKAMAWAIESGIVSGSNGLLLPNDSCTRAMAAAMINRI